MKHTVTGTALISLLLAACGGDSSSNRPAADVVQVDRMGRPAIATGAISLGTTDELNNGYNSEADRNQWSSRFRAEIQRNLEILDEFAGDPAGNALLGDSSLLAGVLVDDRLQIDTSQATCNQYLAVELGVNGDCGGRTLTRDVIDDSIQALTGIAGAGDGAVHDSALIAEFPFLAPAN